MSLWKPYWRLCRRAPHAAPSPRSAPIEIRPSGVDALVELAVLRVDRCLDLGGVLRFGLRTVERHPGGEIDSHLHRQLVDDAAADAKANCAELAGAVGARLQPVGCGKKVFRHLAAVE